jgi:hypothetical protein
MPEPSESYEAPAIAELDADQGPLETGALASAISSA